MTLGWRLDAPPNLVKLVVGRCLIAEMDPGKWTELGLLTDTQERIQNHSRLLRSLHWGDDDYKGHVLDFLPVLLDEQEDPAEEPWRLSHRSFEPPPPPPPPPPPQTLHERFPNLEVVTEFLSLPAWLAQSDEKLFERLMSDVAGDATMPDGTVLSAADSAAARLGVDEMRRQVDRIRRDHSADPEAAIGQAKDLIETFCKTILGMTGDADTVRSPPRGQLGWLCQHVEHLLGRGAQAEPLLDHSPGGRRLQWPFHRSTRRACSLLANQAVTGGRTA
jgi:hypothetical protein